MHETLTLLVSWLSGGVLGTIFFGGLWWTVGKAVSSPRPARWFFGSMLLRMGIVLAGLYFVSDGHWQRLLACFVGFVMARLVVTWLTRPPGRTRPAREARHAP